MTNRESLPAAVWLKRSWLFGLRPVPPNTPGAVEFIRRGSVLLHRVAQTDVNRLREEVMEWDFEKGGPREF